MKNITQLSLFVALVFSLFGAEAGAQVYTPDWQDRVGPNNITAVYNYDFDQSFRRRVYRNIGPYYLPNWQGVAEDVINTGSGIDTISVDYGGQILVQILNMDNTPTGVQHIFNLSTFPPPTISVYDIIYGQPPLIRFRVDINSAYGLGRPSYYVSKLKCRLQRTFPSFWEQTVEWTFPIGIVPFAEFSLPFDFFGDYCVQWFVTDEDTSLDSHFGEITVWESEVMCFSYGSTGIQSDRMKVEFGSFPNPFTDVVTIESPSVADYIVLSTSGQRVASGKLFVGHNRLYELSGLTPGVYILQTDLGQTKIVKQ